MAYQLSEGSLEMIMAGGQLDKPVMQILGNKKIQGSGANERYRLLVSDGKHSLSFAMLATQLNDKLISGELSDYSVVRIDRYITSVLNNSGKGEKRVMIVLDVTVIAPGTQVGGKIGNPVTWTEGSAPPAPAQAPLQPAPSVQPVQAPMQRPPPARPGTSAMDSSMLQTQMTHPISSLSPYQNKWVIKARVMSKSAVRTWSNARGEGKLFSMELCDDSGEIRATAFKAECDKFYDIIQVDKVYYISRCTLKTANKQFTSVKNDYEMTFNSDTVVAECLEETDLPTIKYDYVPIGEIPTKNSDTLIDIIGVCKNASDVQELTARSTGRQLKKRDVTIVDSTGGVSLTLWGSEAESFDGSSNPVMAIKGVRLSEFQGSKQLSCVSGSVMRLNPDIPEAYKLRGWYDNGGADMEIVNISARSGTFAGGSAEWMTFSQAEAKQLGSGEKGDYFQLLGVLTFTFSDNAIYKACPQEQCNKKLVDQENGLFRCEKCNRDYPNYKYRILLAATVSDPTGDQRVTAFNESAEAMLGTTAAEVGRMFDYDKKAYAELFDNVKFKTFLFKFRTKMETYSDEARLKTIVMSAQPVDYKDANARLVKSIAAATGIQV